MSANLPEWALKDILNTMNDGLFMVDPRGRIVMVNDALLQTLGYEREDLLGKSCSVLKCDVCKVSRAKGGDRWCRLFDTRREERKSCRLQRKDGSFIHALKNASLLQRDGEVVGAVETVTDVTEIVRRDETIKDLKRQLDGDEGYSGMTGISAAMQRTFRLLDRAAQSDAPVIIYGESGTGKELAARAIHEQGPRRQGPFIQFNCAALNDSLLESELFGHAKGAFTGAVTHRQGRFEVADGGDIFLDEIGDVPPATQVKLLRVLETKQFERVGEHRSMTVDVRIITATNQDLEQLVRRGTFREDLYFRINVIPIHLPPLRERREDIPLLVDSFLRRLQKKTGKPIKGLSPEAMQLFMLHHWPGNVRELKSALEYAFVVMDTGVIEPDHLPLQISRLDPCGQSASLSGPTAGGSEREQLLSALEQAGWNKSQAARILGVSRATVHNRMRRFGIGLKTIVSS
mgnify:CR=1 FL=1